MHTGRYPKFLLDVNIIGKRPKGRPAKRWTDGIKESCKSTNPTSINQVARMALDREAWRDIMNQMGRQSDSPVPTP